MARRLIRFASEDVGLADPSALVQAVAAFQVRCFVVWGRSNFSKAAHMIGMPECNVILAQCVAYLSRAPKSVAVYKYTSSFLTFAYPFVRAYQAVQDCIHNEPTPPVPLHISNAPTPLMKALGYLKVLRANMLCLLILL